MNVKQSHLDAIVQGLGSIIYNPGGKQILVKSDSSKIDLISYHPYNRNIN